MYVEGDKGTGRFGFTVGVLLEGIFRRYNMITKPKLDLGIHLVK